MSKLKKKPNHLPGIPAGLVARSTSNGISLTWVKSVDPITAVDADSYEVHRANQLGGSSRRISNNVIVPNYHDTSVKRGELYFYSVKAKNRIGISLPSVALAANAGLPNPWLSRDIGDVQKSGFSEFNLIASLIFARSTSTKIFSFLASANHLPDAFICIRPSTL